LIPRDEYVRLIEVVFVVEADRSKRHRRPCHRGAQAPGSHSYRLVPREAKRPNYRRMLYRNAFASISLMARVLKGNFREHLLHAFWRSATDRVAPARIWVVKCCAGCQKCPAGTPSKCCKPRFPQSKLSPPGPSRRWRALVTMLMAFGAAWIAVVALKDIAAEVDGVRSIPALASAVAWLGSGVGGILMGWIADKVGTRWTVICGSLMIGLGLMLSTFGPPGPLWIG